jgi:hypothetical protein
VAETLPTDESNEYAVQLAPSVEDATGALFVHRDYVKVRDEWAIEQHVGPPKAHEVFGDVESWVAYVQRFGHHQQPLLTWNSGGFHAVLDYHQNDGLEGTPGRLLWVARMPFEHSAEWKAWQTLANGQARSQRETIEQLEDRGAEIVEPSPGGLMALLRNLRATVNKSAEAELRSDGTTSVRWADDKNVGARGGTTDLPAEISIAIPILKGVDALYKLAVRLRVSVNDQAKLSFRLTIPNADKALGLAYVARVEVARTLLGDDFTVLRAAG